ncbi:tyrosine-type recombinase/integrase [Microbacterium sp.]|uniref:tyrosine-type recombinase/integrase n=1 Tax=Microbacterium sp. TaxID=51671 RepID=UPI002896F5F2|nr:tyrosine-type recombinase/integrase [Microbacterium sp.]
MALFDEENTVWRAMLDGWAAQQVSRNLAASTIRQRREVANRFQRFSENYPWAWTVQQVDNFFLELRTIKNSAHTTVLGYQNALRGFIDYLTDDAYGWVEECINRFGQHPAQVFHEWNTARHVQSGMASPSKRAYTREELEDLFDCADDRVERIRRSNSKGWIPAFRTATIMKTAYAWGLRRNEVRMLDLVDLAMNPRARQFGSLGIVYVRFGKAMKGSPPKRRAVLTLPEFSWAKECLEEWIHEVRPLATTVRSTTLWPSERGNRMAPIEADSLSRSFSMVRREAGLNEGLDFHSLRRSYVTHLVELGYDLRFIQEQVGHEHASTTGIYTHTSPDYRARVVDDAIARAAEDAMRPPDQEE